MTSTRLPGFTLIEMLVVIAPVQTLVAPLQWLLMEDQEVIGLLLLDEVLLEEVLLEEDQVPVHVCYVASSGGDRSRCVLW